MIPSRSIFDSGSVEFSYGSGKERVESKPGREDGNAGGRTDFPIAHVSARRSGTKRDGEKICSSLPTGAAEIEEVTRERRVRKLFIALSFRANSRVSRRGSERRYCTRCRSSRSSSVIFQGAVDDNAIRGSGRQCRRNFSFAKKFHRGAFCARASEFRNNKKRSRQNFQDGLPSSFLLRSVLSFFVYN